MEYEKLYEKHRSWLEGLDTHEECVATIEAHTNTLAEARTAMGSALRARVEESLKVLAEVAGGNPSGGGHWTDSAVGKVRTLEQVKACHKAACDKVSVKTILQNMNEAQEALGAEKTLLEASGATELPADHETGKQLIMKAKSTKCELTCMYWIRADKITKKRSQGTG